MIAPADLSLLARELAGELHTGDTWRTIYATDASEYQETPIGVALPRDENDVRRIIAFAHRHRLGLIPRTAGTSLAGQVVGSSLVLDLGRHLNRIVDFDPIRRRVRVQPGVVRNELNLFLQPHGLWFTPETSTANRAMIGGMVGNNSCGANSIVHGATRDHLLSARGFLSDGSEVTFGPLTATEFRAKCHGPDTLETRIYRAVDELLGDADNRRLIVENFPHRAVTRRNTGYALDALMECALFDPASDQPFNLCRLIAGSEGTLFVGVEFELNCEPLPPAGALLCAHFASVHESLQATVVAMRHRPFGCELIDRHILECTKANLAQAPNRFFVQGDPGAVLVVEVRHADRSVIERTFAELIAELRAARIGYAFPILWGDDCNRVWDLRRAGQGLMANVPGDAKPREVVEDTAVAVADLPAYIAEFDALLREKYNIGSVYYAHAGAGELHTRPLFNLKTPEGLRMFREIATDVAALVKKYRGSLSGEHGDGRLRGEFIPFMVGPACFAMMRRIKQTFDPHNLLNPGKIIDTPPMDTSLRHSPDHPTPDYETIFRFRSEQGVVRATEQCNGVGECRKSHLMGGTMCPSYMATHEEKHTTRARATTLRQVLSAPAAPNASPWDHPSLPEVMDLCLSCKGCKSECPSNVDLARLKSEWLQHRHDRHGVPLRSRLVAGFARSMRLAALAPGLYNRVVRSPRLSLWLKRFAGFAPARSLPTLPSITLVAWHRRHANPPHLDYPHGRVHLFCDEFTNFTDASIGIQAVQLLNRLGYEVAIPPHTESGRAHFSKGLVRDARRFALENVRQLSPVVTAAAPLIGLEPSALLSFRDEYLDLVPDDLLGAARELAANSFLIEEFLAREMDAGRITSAAFRTETQHIKLHGHCHQKALSSLTPVVKILELPPGHRVTLIPSGCCGMAGSFGFEAEHYAVSQQIGELVLFPAVRNTPTDTVICAPGTSCRHQIHDATARRALHPVEILHAALKPMS